MILKSKIQLRNDKAKNWKEANSLLGKGEIGIEIDTGLFKIGTGVPEDTWNNLPYVNDVKSHTTIVESEDARKKLTGMVSGDVCIVKTRIVPIQPDQTPVEKYSYTCYIYDAKASTNDKWVAADGNYGADNVIFNKNITITEPIGTVTAEEIRANGGSVNFDAAGKSLIEVLGSLFAEEDSSNLQKSQPYVYVTNNVDRYVELGSTIIPVCTANLNDGTYKYGPEPTGVTASNYFLKNNKDATSYVSGKSHTFNAYTFNDVSSYTVTAKCDTTEGAIPKSNIGNNYGAQRFTEKLGRTSSETTICTSYMPNFYGYIATEGSKVNLNNTSINNSVIRALQKNQLQNPTPVSSYDIGEKWFQFIYALPAGRKNSMSAKDGNNITFTVTKITGCKVEFGDEIHGKFTKDYDVFIIDNAAQYAATKIQMSW